MKSANGFEKHCKAKRRVNRLEGCAKHFNNLSKDLKRSNRNARKLCSLIESHDKRIAAFEKQIAALEKHIAGLMDQTQARVQVAAKSDVNKTLDKLQHELCQTINHWNNHC